MSTSSNVPLSFQFDNDYNKSHYFLETVHLKQTINKAEFPFSKINASDKYNVQLFHLSSKCLGGNKTLQNQNFPCVTKKKHFVP